MIQIPMTPAEYEAAGTRVQAQQGISLTGNQGTLSKMGVTAAYKYDGAMLSINIVDKPFFVTEEYCESEIRKFIAV